VIGEEVEYDPAVSASAEHFKQATARAAEAMSIEERVLRALALGQSDLEIYAAANGVTLERARLELRQRRERERRRGAGSMVR
jgi:hypothetical protein